MNAKPIEADRIWRGIAIAAAYGLPVFFILLPLCGFLVYSLFWRRYTRAGLLATLIGGTLTVLVLMPGTNLVSGSPTSAFPGVDFNWFPFTTTGIVSIPLGFAYGWLGTVVSGRRKSDEQRRQYEAVEGWILAGAVRRRT